MESLQNDEVESVEPMSDVPTYREWAKERIETYREAHTGSTVGETPAHRGWPPEVVLAFLAAPIIKPERGSIQRKLYGS